MTVKHGLGWTEGTEAEKVTMPSGHHWIATDSGIIYRSNGTGYVALYPSVLGDGAGRGFVWQFYSNLGASANQWTNMPSAVTEYDSTANVYTQRANLSGVNKFRLHIEAVTTAPINGSKIGVQYSSDGGSTWKAIDSDTTNAQSTTTINFDGNLGIFVSSEGTIHANAQVDNVLIRIVGSGGNGTTDPEFINQMLFVYKDTWDSIAIPYVGANSTTWTNIPAAVTEFAGTTNRRMKLDLTNVDRFVLNTNVSSGAFAGSKLGLQYSADNGVTWKSIDGDVVDAQSKMYLSISATGSSYSGEGIIHANARTNVLVRVVGSDGDGIADPVFKYGQVIFYKSSVGIKNNTYQLIQSSSGQTYTNMPSGVNPISGGSSFDSLADLTNMKYFMVLTRLAAAATATSVIGVQYSLDAGSTWKALDLGVASVQSANVATLAASTGWFISGIGTINPEARGKVLLRPATSGGDGVADPQFSNVQIIVYR